MRSRCSTRASRTLSRCSGGRATIPFDLAGGLAILSRWLTKSVSALCSLKNRLAVVGIEDHAGVPWSELSGESPGRSRSFMTSTFLISVSTQSKAARNFSRLTEPAKHAELERRSFVQGCFRNGHPLNRQRDGRQVPSVSLPQRMAGASCAGTEAPRFRRSRPRTGSSCRTCCRTSGRTTRPSCPRPHQIRRPCFFAHSRSRPGDCHLLLASPLQQSIERTTPRPTAVTRPDPTLFFWRAVSVCPSTRGTSVLRFSPTNCLTSMASTSAGSIWLLRNSTTRLNSGGISSAMKSKRTRPAWRFVFTCCQNADAS